MSRFAGMGALIHLALRRDRILLPAWIVLFPLLTVASASATMALYPDEASRKVAASAVNEVPVAVALYGRIWDPTSLGALSLLKLAALGGVMIGVLAIMLVTRHSRGEEEAGRTELLGASAVGRWAVLSAAMIVVVIAMAAIGLLSAVGLMVVGLPPGGSWAFGLAWAATGTAIAAVAALAGQVTASARAANALALAALGIAFLVRAIGDVTGDSVAPSALSWLSPIGWGQQVRPYAGDRWAVLLIPVAFALLVLALAFTFQSRRDLGAGLLPERAGRPAAPPSLARPVALAWRLQYGLLLGWTAGYLIVSIIFGSIVSDLSGMLDTPQAQRMVQALGGTRILLDAFTAMEFGIIAFVTAAYGIVATRRLAVEEAEGRLEPLLATSVGRGRYLGSHLAVALVGTLQLALVQGAGFAFASAASSGTTERIGATMAASAVWLPAIWFMVALVVLAFGLRPRLTQLTWAALIAFLIIAEFGALLDWPSWVMDTSPFAHIPRLPAESMDWAPIITLLALSAAVAALGAAAFRQRDLATP